MPQVLVLMARGSALLLTRGLPRRTLVREAVMEANEGARLSRTFLQALITADKAETALRCYFTTHQGSAGVSDLDEYRSLHAQQQRAADARHQAYLALIGHQENAGPVGCGSV